MLSQNVTNLKKVVFDVLEELLPHDSRGGDFLGGLALIFTQRLLFGGKTHEGGS